MMTSMMGTSDELSAPNESGAIESKDLITDMVSGVANGATENDMEAIRAWLDTNPGDIQSLVTDIEYSYRKKKTKREEFLEIMEEIIPWDEWVGVIEPYYPKGKRGRPPMGIEKMLRMYLLQIWFNLSDPATEDAIYDSYAMRKFTGIDFMTETVPDETTLCKFRHLLETNGLNKLFFDAINRVMVQTGHMMKGGTIVDATIINATSSTKNAEKKRDPEMHQTKKGNEWKFGMKCHIGVDAGSGLVHTITVTAANEHDITQPPH